MPTREMQRFMIVMSLCLAVVLIAAAFLFSAFFEWRGSGVQYGEVERQNSVSEPCTPPSATANASKGALEELRPLEPEQEDLLLADSVLAPAEVIDLSEDLSKIRRIPAAQISPVRLRWSEVPGAKSYQLKAWQLVDNKKVVLFEGKIEKTEFRLTPPHEGNVYWEVAAVDAKGVPGKTAGPITIKRSGQ